jgi:hypothetical protein
MIPEKPGYYWCTPKLSMSQNRIIVNVDMAGHARMLAWEIGRDEGQLLSDYTDWSGPIKELRCPLEQPPTK